MLFVLTLLVNVLARWFVVRADAHAVAPRCRPLRRSPEAGVSAVAGSPSRSPRSAPGAAGADRVVRAVLLGAATAVALVPLVLVVYYLHPQGRSAR